MVVERVGVKGCFEIQKAKTRARSPNTYPTNILTSSENRPENHYTVLEGARRFLINKSMLHSELYAVIN